MKTNMKPFPVTVIVPMRNSSTTVLLTLRSILLQKYPVKEIIVVDNVSTDDSISKVNTFSKKYTRVPIRLIKRKKNHGVGSSYNLGVKKARSEYVVFMHSDSSLPSSQELMKLTQPMRKDPSVVATYSYVIVPVSLWEEMPFWEKCLLTAGVKKPMAGLNGKFDCLKREVFMNIGGFDEVYYGHDILIGGEDGDLHVRLQEAGTVVCSEARVIHLHSLDPGYSYTDWIINRKLLARSYGRFLRIQWRHLEPGALFFAIKPVLAILPFIFPWMFGVSILLIFAVIYMSPIYRSRVSRSDSRSLILPFIIIFLIYYESFWMLQSFLFLKKK